MGAQQQAVARLDDDDEASAYHAQKMSTARPPQPRGGPAEQPAVEASLKRYFRASESEHQ